MRQFLVILFVFLIASCKRKDEYIPVKGRIMSSIDSTLPFSNSSFKFYKSIIGSGKIYTQPFVTDTLGYVNETINLKEFDNGFYICWPNGNNNEYIDFITLEYNQKSVDFGIIYTKP
jgi:hypothetical protein